MKVVELLTEADKKKKIKIKPPKPRPKKNLWFMDRNLWHMDLQHARPGFQLHHTDEENEEDNTYFATDGANPNIVHGVWQGKKKRGITFERPRHMNVVKHPRMQIRPFEMPKQSSNNVVSRPVIKTERI